MGNGKMVKRTEQIMIRETPERRKQIEESADAAGLSVTEYLRQMIRLGEYVDKMNQPDQKISVK